MECSKDWKGTVLSIELWLIGMALILPILVLASEKKFVAVALVAGLGGACLVGAVYVREPKFRRQTSIAMAGLGVFSICGTAIFAPVFAGAKVAATRAGCMSDIKQGALALVMYCSDFDDRFPASGSWRDRAKPFGLSDAMNCADAKAPWSFGFNDEFSTANLDNIPRPEKSVLLFEAESFAKNAAGGQDWFVPRHHGQGNVAFIDTHCNALKTPTDRGAVWSRKLTTSE